MSPAFIKPYNSIQYIDSVTQAEILIPVGQGLLLKTGGRYSISSIASGYFEVSSHPSLLMTMGFS